MKTDEMQTDSMQSTQCGACRVPHPASKIQASAFYLQPSLAYIYVPYLRLPFQNNSIWVHYMLVLTWLTLTLTQLGVHSWSWVHIYFISFDFSKIYFAKLSNAQWAWSTNNNLPAEVHTQRQPSITLSKSNAHSRVILCSLESITVLTRE